MSDNFSPIRILLLVSNPLDAPVNIGPDVAALTDALRDLNAPATFVVQLAEADRVSALLARGDHTPFQVVHYLGHGYKPAQKQTGYLVLEDPQGAARLLEPIHLHTMLNPTGGPPEFQLAVLLACHSESVADAFFALGVRHVIAIDAAEAVYERAAVQFCQRFYQALLTGRTVQAAFTAGRNAVLNDEQLGRDTAMQQARKFKLLPEDQPHDEVLLVVRAATAPVASGPVQVQPLPQLTHAYFSPRPHYFVGRNEDMHALLQLLQQHRAVQIKGVSGVGKSELARETAHWLAARGRINPAHTFFVPLAPARTAEDVRRAIVTALNRPLELPVDEGAANSALAGILPPAALLILDEAENAVTSAGLALRTLLETLAGAAARPLLLLTTQTPVRSDRWPVLTLERLTPAAALQLFIRTTHLTPTESQQIDEAQVQTLLGYVDRLPRAVELVGRVWRASGDPDLQALLSELRQRRDQLLQDPDYPAEVKGITVGVQLAYDRLRLRDRAAAELYAQLALFPGGFTVAGVVASFGDTARRALAAIENQSLLERPWPDLLYLPTPFRHFAERQLPHGLAAAQNEAGAAVLRFYFDFEDEPQRGWVNQLDDALQSGGETMGARIARYQAELPSIESWLDWAYAHEACDGGRSRGPRLTALLENLYVVTSTLRHQRSRLTQALAQATRCADRLGEANVLCALGDLALREANLKSAREHYLAALAIYPAIGDRLGEANVLRALGDLARVEGNLDQAVELIEKAVKLYRQIGNVLGEANGYVALGQATDEAHYFEEALAIHRQIQDTFSVARDTYYYGLSQKKAGHREQAILLLTQARDLWQAIGLAVYADYAQTAINQLNEPNEPNT